MKTVVLWNNITIKNVCLNFFLKLFSFYPVLEVGRYAPVRSFYILAFRVPALFCAYRHFWSLAGTQSKIVRVWVIRLYIVTYYIYIYIYVAVYSKWYRNYVKHPTPAGSPLISTHHVNERKQSRSTSLCGAREGEAVSGEMCGVVDNNNSLLITNLNQHFITQIIS